MKNAEARKTIRTVRTKKGVKKYTYLGCPMTRNRSAWCYRLCPPDAEGHGRCGRVAPHSLKGRTQLAIEAYNKKRLNEHLRKLENMYLSFSADNSLEPGIRVLKGEAEILIPMREKSRGPAGTALSAVCYQAMVDSAAYAVNSTVDRFVVKSETFSTYQTEAVRGRLLVARGRYVGVFGDYYVAESVLTNSEGLEIARGSGTFVAAKTPLSADVGYE